LWRKRKKRDDDDDSNVNIDVYPADLFLMDPDASHNKMGFSFFETSILSVGPFVCTG
jgi:hypothetical protein